MRIIHTLFLFSKSLFPGLKHVFYTTLTSSLLLTEPGRHDAEPLLSNSIGGGGRGGAQKTGKLQEEYKEKRVGGRVFNLFDGKEEHMLLGSSFSLTQTRWCTGWSAPSPTASGTFAHRLLSDVHVFSSDLIVLWDNPYSLFTLIHTLFSPSKLEGQRVGGGAAPLPRPIVSHWYCCRFRWLW